MTGASMTIEKSQATAVLKKLRRKSRRAIKQAGVDPMGLLKPATGRVGEDVVTGDRLYVTERVALHKAQVLQRLNATIDKGGPEGLAAAARKRTMNDRWENRDTNTAKGYWKPGASGKVTSVNPEGYVFNN